MNTEALRRAVRLMTDEQGKPVVQIPLELWERLLAEIGDIPQHERIKALLAEWETNPDTTPAEWWDEFQSSLKANRLKITERDLGL